MTTIKELQDAIDDRSLDPRKLSKEQRQIIDELIRRGDLTGPTTSDLTSQRDSAAREIARREIFPDRFPNTGTGRDGTFGLGTFGSGRPSD